jgi:hypothetical protein
VRLRDPTSLEAKEGTAGGITSANATGRKAGPILGKKEGVVRYAVIDEVDANVPHVGGRGGKQRSGQAHVRE